MVSAIADRKAKRVSQRVVCDVGILNGGIRTETTGRDTVYAAAPHAPIGCPSAFEDHGKRALSVQGCSNDYRLWRLRR